MDEATLITKIIAEAQQIIAEALQYGSPAHAYQEIDELVSHYIATYPTIITHADDFSRRVHEALFGQ